MKNFKKCESFNSFKAENNIVMVTKGECKSKWVQRRTTGAQTKACVHYIGKWNLLGRLELWITSLIEKA